MNLKHDKNLAELIGMILGDGNLGRHPRCHYLRVYCNIKEKQYAKEIKKILKIVFKKKSYEYERPSEGVEYLEISLTNLDKLLQIPIGDKIKNQVKIPKWIFSNINYIIACLRGLFDTDGCCYLTGGKYQIINFTNKNKALLADIKKSLGLLRFNPYESGGRNVELGRQEEVKRFFNIIRPRNLKHYRYNARVAKVVKAHV